MPEKSTLFEFDVLLSHNSKDKPTVRQLDEALSQRKLKVWFDERNLIPGQPIQEALEKVIGSVRAVAVLIGNDGLGPWEDVEMRACLAQFVSRKAPVIPVLLPGAPAEPKLPMFLSSFMWVDLRDGLSQHGLERLVLGITYKENNQPDAPPKPPPPPEPNGPDEPPKKKPPQFNAGDLEIVTCFLHQERWEKLRHLREWTANLHEPMFENQTIRVSPAPNLKAAFDRVPRRPEATILLLDGFKPEGSQLDEYVDPRLKPHPFI